MQNQLEVLSTKLNEISNRKEPVVAFRATSVKDSGSSQEQRVSKNPGKSLFFRSLQTEYYFIFLKLFGKKSTTILEVVSMLTAESSLRRLMVSIFSTHRVELMEAVMHTFIFMLMGRIRPVLLGMKMENMIQLQ